VDNFCEILDAPMVPQPDWATDAQLDALEIGMDKIAKDTQGIVDVIKPDLTEKRKKEADLLTDYHKNPAASTFTPLYNSFKPLIIQAASKNMRGSTIPQAAHMAYAAQSFLDATRTFNPKMGGSFRTHMYNTVFEKGKRLNLKYQNIGYIPESRATKYQAYQTALHLLREDLGREPSSIEIADESGISIGEIEKLRTEVKKDLIAHEHLVGHGLAFAQSDKAMQVARDIMYSLEPKHALVLEHMVGLNGKDSLVKKSGKSDIPGIAKATGLGMNDVRSARKTIKRKFHEYRAFMGKGVGIDSLYDESEEE
jgi:DNA-directed RNA polymerase specialized sigma subunit